MKVRYIGWTGNNNLGDETCLVSIKKFLYNVDSNIEIIDSVPDGKLAPEQDAVILGGGTLLRMSGDSRSSLLNVAMQRKIPIYLWGTGIVDIPYEKDDKMLPEVKSILEYARCVTVRGPRSKADLGREGYFGASIVGDPGLFIYDGTFTEPRNSNLVGISIGSTCHNLYGSESYIAETIKRLIPWLINKGYRPILFHLWDRDKEVTDQIPRDLGQEVIPYDPSILNFIDMMNNFRYVIGMKLHSIVTSASLGIPIIGLAYRNKCFDFAESIGLEKYCVRTDTPNLIDRIKDLFEDIKINERDLIRKMMHQKDYYRTRHENLAHRIVEGR